MNYGTLFSDELQKQGARAIPDTAVIDFLKKTKQHERLFNIAFGKPGPIDPMAERMLFMNRTVPKYRTNVLKEDILSRQRIKANNDMWMKPDVSLRQYDDYTDSIGREARKKFFEERKELARQGLLEMYRNMKLVKKPRPFNSADLFIA